MHVLQHGSAHAVIAHVGAKPKPLIGLDGIGAAILQAVGSNLVEQPYTTPLLAQIQKRSTPRFSDALQRGLQLRSTIAAHTEQRVTGEALRMDANQYRLRPAHIAKG